MSEIKHHNVTESSVIKGLAPMEIYNKVVNLLRNDVPSQTMVCEWEVKFKYGHTDYNSCLKSDIQVFCTQF